MCLACYLQENEYIGKSVILLLIISCNNRKVAITSFSDVKTKEIHLKYFLRNRKNFSYRKTSVKDTSIEDSYNQTFWNIRKVLEVVFYFKWINNWKLLKKYFYIQRDKFLCQIVLKGLK